MCQLGKVQASVPGMAVQLLILQRLEAIHEGIHMLVSYEFDRAEAGEGETKQREQDSFDAGAEFGESQAIQARSIGFLQLRFDEALRKAEDLLGDTPRKHEGPRPSMDVLRESLAKLRAELRAERKPMESKTIVGKQVVWCDPDQAFVAGGEVVEYDPMKFRVRIQWSLQDHRRPTPLITWVGGDDVMVPVPAISLMDWLFEDPEPGDGVAVVTDESKLADRLAKLAALEPLLDKAREILAPDYECGMEGVCDMLQELVDVQ